jgi:hypothetical protein
VSGDGRSRTDIFLVASEALVQLSYIPPCGKTRCGRVESNHHSTRRQGYSLLSSPNAQRPHELRVAGRARTGASGDHNPGCFRLHHGHHESGDDRTRTGGLSPDKRVLCASELRPRTKSQLRVRLARTASPPPRKSGWQESNLRSPAPKAGGVSNSPTAR